MIMIMEAVPVSDLPLKVMSITTEVRMGDIHVVPTFLLQRMMLWVLQKRLVSARSSKA